MASVSSRSNRRPAAVSRRIGLARAAIFWEGLLTRLWRGVTILMMFAGLALLGLWAWLPGILHVVLLALFVIAIPGRSSPPIRLVTNPVRPVVPMKNEKITAPKINP